MILADSSSLLSAPVQYGALGLCALLIAGYITTVTLIIKSQASRLTAQDAQAQKNTERYLESVTASVAALTLSAEMNKRTLEALAVAEDRNRNDRRAAGR